MRKLALAMIFIGCLLLTIYCARAVQINEIMPDPVGDDYDFEYIELYAENLSDISNYSFDGISFTFPDNFSFEGYIVLANTNHDDGEDNDFTDRYNFSADFEFSGSLSNTGETIILYDANHSVTDSVSYSQGTEGYSLEYHNGSFVDSLVLHGTPGSINQFVNQSLENQTNSTNQTNTTNATNTTNTTTSANTTNTTPANTTDNTNTTNLGCDFSIDILLDKEIYENKEKISYILNLSHKEDDEDYDFQIEYYIEDLYGEIVRAKRNTTTPGAKSFTPSIKEADKIFFIKAQVYSFCNETDLADNSDSALIIVRNSAFEETSEEEEDEEDELDKEEEDIGSSTVFKKAEIESFYTRHKIFEEGKSINLYAMLYNRASEADFDVVLLNNGIPVEEVKIPMKAEYKKRWNISVILEPGLNNFSIGISRYGEQEDLKSLEIFAESDEEEAEKSKNETLSVKSPMPEKQTNVSALKTHQSKTKDAEENKERSIVQYIILGVSVALNSLLIWKR